VQVLERFTDEGHDTAAVLRIRILGWLVFASACLALGTVDRMAAVAAAAVGVLLALAVLPDTALGRLAAAAGIALAGAGPGDEISVAVVLLGGAALVALAPVPRSRTRSADAESAQVEIVQRHLARARRRAERAHVLLMSFAPDEGQKPSEVTSFFRLTDSVSMRRRGTAYEVLAVLDDHELDRAALEHRINSSLSAQPQLGWASFPDDGYTLGDLVHRARERQAAEAVAAIPPSPNGHHKTRLAG
jgi:hypothetical protein